MPPSRAQCELFLHPHIRPTISSRWSTSTTYSKWFQAVLIYLFTYFYLSKGEINTTSVPLPHSQTPSCFKWIIFQCNGFSSSCHWNYTQLWALSNLSNIDMKKILMRTSLTKPPNTSWQHAYYMKLCNLETREQFMHLSISGSISEKKMSVSISLLFHHCFIFASVPSTRTYF